MTSVVTTETRQTQIQSVSQLKFSDQSGGPF